jgi:xanthine dehydrogenase accessory factor
MSRAGVLPEDLLTRVEGLRQDRTPFVLATVVRAERPTSARPGDRAVVLPDGTIEGFVGGVCAESTVRLEGLRLLRDGTSTLLRISPSGGDDAGASVAGTSPVEGLITVDNPCLSGGTLEIFLEAMVPPTVVVVLGDGPVARALESIGSALDYDVRTTSGSDESVPAGAAAVIVASHGRGEEPVLTQALRAGVPYVALVASRKRGTAVLDGLDVGDRQRVRTPAGLDIGARTPPEVALVIYAEIVATRAHRVWSVSAATGEPFPVADAAAEPFAVDPVCGMSVACVPASPSAVVGGTTHWFCGLGCRQAFLDPARDDAPTPNGAR